MKTHHLPLLLAGLLLCGQAAALPAGMQCAQPQWPREALRYDLEGTTTLEYTPRRDGSIRDVRVRKSSGWRILDEASLAQVRLCSMPPDPARDETTVEYLQHVWKLEGEERARPVLMSGTCTPSASFDEFSHAERPLRYGISLRFLVRADGTPHHFVAETPAPADVLAEAIAFASSCKFALAPLPQPRTDAAYGRALMRATP